MTNKPNLPGELDPGTKEFSFRRDFAVNRWGYLALVLATAGDMLVHCHKESQQWPVVLRVIIALCPLPPALLWTRSFCRWLSGMDELDRQITLKVCLFATTATLYLYMALHPLAKWVGPLGKPSWLIDWHSWLLQTWVMICFYIIGSRIFNRRYR